MCAPGDPVAATLPPSDMSEPASDRKSRTATERSSIADWISSPPPDDHAADGYRAHHLQQHAVALTEDGRTPSQNQEDIKLRACWTALRSGAMQVVAYNPIATLRVRRCESQIKALHTGFQLDEPCNRERAEMNAVK
jgi:hypothetical protein